MKYRYEHHRTRLRAEVFRMLTQTALWGIVVLLVLLLLEQGHTLEAVGYTNSILEPVRDAARKWERKQRESEYFPEPEVKLTPEEKQRRDEQEQLSLSRLVEDKLGGWNTAQVLCRHRVGESPDIEYLLTTQDRIIIVRQGFESFYRNGEYRISQPLELGAEVHYAMQGTGLGEILAENQEGRILRLRFVEDKVREIS